MKRLACLMLIGLIRISTAQASAPYNVEWSRQLGTTSDDSDDYGGVTVAVDGSGNAYISGSTVGSLGGPNAGFYDAYLTKYNPSGTLQWSRQIGTTDLDEGRDVAVDGSGNAYITGRTRGSLGGPNAGPPGTFDAFVTKYNSAGTLQWSRTIGTTSHEDCFGVAVDGSGNAYITGITGGSLGGPSIGDADVFLTKYNSVGTLQWSRQFGTTDLDFSLGVAVDGAGNAYISGYTGGSLGGPNAGNADAFLTKYDGAGNLQWSRQIGTSEYDYSAGVAVDGAGNAYISGATFGSLGGPTAGPGDAFLTKYNSAGTLQWSRQIGTTSDDGSDDVAVDGSGNAYISGGTQGSLGGPNAGPGQGDAFLTKYNSAGTLQWSRQIGTTDADGSNGVAVDGAGNAFISGVTYGSLGGPNAGGRDAFLVKFAVPEPSTFVLLIIAAADRCLRRDRAV